MIYQFLNQEQLEKLIKASDELLDASKKVYKKNGVGMADLLIAINKYELTKIIVEQELDQSQTNYETYIANKN